MAIALAFRAFAKLRIADKDGARADFDEAIRRAPKDAGAYFGRWQANYRLGRFSAGVLDLQTNLSLQPNQPYPVLLLRLLRAK